MQIGSKSNTYLKQIQSRAKMHEYHVAEKDYVQIEEKAQWIIISAIDIICEFAEEIIESEANIQMDWKKYMVKLRFAMRFFDSFSKSELAGGNVEYFELLGSAIYYLGGRNGSSKVMADNISDDLDLECSSIDKTLLAILRMDKEYEYEGTNELLIEIVAELKRSLNYGDQFNYKNLKKFREEVYLYGSNREVIFSDILIAVIYLKLYNSAYCLLPLYTGVEKKIWKDILNRNTLVKELWAAQKELGENDIFRGKSATIQMPTGSGKTKSIALIIESAFLMQRTTEVMIVTPFRSLCREITDELSNAFSYTENISVTAISDILQEDYIVKYEKEYTIRLSEDEEKAIEFISKKLASGKRIHELELLKRTLQYHHGIIGRLQKHLSEKYHCEMDEYCTENVINMMTNEFPTSAAKKTYAQCVFLKKEQDDYGISDVYGKMLQNPEFCAILEELVDFGISRYKVNYSYHYQDTNLVLYQKYTYEDACRLLNWERNEVPLNIGGYKYDKKTRTFPIFINYDKQDNISDTTKYEDHFVAENRLIAISKSGRSMDSEDVQNSLKATERGIDVQLFVRKNKDDKISKEFYYLGHVIATGNAKQFVMPNTDKTAVEIEWELETPVREDIYQYILNE